ncbi:polysaccharide deacetylase family protein [Roseomonas sp. KE0001]|uniref:polysaccharide deacetylase family protein n=1 Tax=Roseomonas sp. KE0001 TaxID=2479201 RepID=UPI0018DEF7CC|nr:polysaccharide deacetylase family protein [Roseomonas sp. KE0001]MBI0434928.1 polysaccharide deacetylase family protein [Roseomonas sp. KE0001]
MSPAPPFSWRRWSPAPLVGASLGLHAGGLAALAAQPGLWPWLAGGLLANHALLTAAGMAPRNGWLGANLRRLPPAGAARRQIALTFDDGPDPAVTPAVLDLLERHGARASFFVIGERAARHPALLREMRRRGHSIENHTHTHPRHFAALGPFGMRREVLSAQAAIGAALGEAPRLFRAPMGLRSPLLDPVLAGAGLGLVSWSRRGLDGASGDARRVAARLAAPRAGEILLLHDGNARRDAAGRPVVLAVLPGLLGAVAAAGLSAVPLPETLVPSPGPAVPAAAAGGRGSPASGAGASS